MKKSVRWQPAPCPCNINTCLDTVIAALKERRASLDGAIVEVERLRNEYQFVREYERLAYGETTVVRNPAPDAAPPVMVASIYGSQTASVVR